MKLLDFNIKTSYRLILWILLLLLTASILIFPVKLQFEYHAVESLYIFGDNLLLFSILYVVWLASLLLLLFSKIAEWQRVVLITIFTLVFLGFWVVNTPYGSYADGMVNMGHVKYLTETGSIPFDHPSLAYFQYPGLHLTALSITEITGLDILVTRTILLVFSRILLAILLYVIFTKSLHNPAVASLSVLLFFHGSLLLQRTMFHPGITAFIFFVILLWILMTYKDGRVMPLMVVFLICFSALTITYLPIPAFFIFAFVGIYIMQQISKKMTYSRSLLIFCVVIFLTWEMYWATRMFSGLAGHTQDLIAAFSNPLERLLPIFNTTTASLGESTPLWASLTRIFWLVVIFVFGAILGIKNLFRYKKLDLKETLETGGLWGVLIFAAVCIFAFPGGTQQSRVLMYASLFTVPIIIRFITNMKESNMIPQSTNINKYLIIPWNKVIKYSIVMIYLVVLVMSLPTFLVNHSDVDNLSVYKYEHSAGEFVETHYDDRSLSFISDILTVYTSVYFVPDAEFASLPQPWEIASGQELWTKSNNLLYELQSSSNTAIFVFTERFDQAYRSAEYYEEFSTEWIEFINILSRNDMIYNNNHSQVYANQLTQ
jgi:hypothetical protein